MVPEMSRIQGIQGGDAHEIIPLGNFGSSIIHHPSQKDTHQIVLCKKKGPHDPNQEKKPTDLANQNSQKIDICMVILRGGWK